MFKAPPRFRPGDSSWFLKDTAMEIFTEAFSSTRNRSKCCGTSVTGWNCTALAMTGWVSSPYFSVIR